MVLVPEDMYAKLQSSSNLQFNSLESPFNYNRPSQAEQRPLSIAQAKMSKLMYNTKAASNDDARHILYNQEFKRYNKLTTDLAERPMRVVNVGAPSSVNNANTSPAAVSEFSEHGFRDDVSTASTAVLKTVTPFQRKIDEITRYLYNNRKVYGIDADMQVLDQHSNKPIKNSDISDILMYHLGENIPQNILPPPGYKPLLKRIANDKFFLDRDISTKPHGHRKMSKRNKRKSFTGSGIRMTTAFKSNIKKKASNKSTISFKPQLW